MEVGVQMLLQVNGDGPEVDEVLFALEADVSPSSSSTTTIGGLRPIDMLRLWLGLPPIR